MALDRNRVRIPWPGRFAGSYLSWLLRLVILSIAVASFVVLNLNSGPAQFGARAVLTALALIAGATQATEVVRDVRAYEWGRWRRFAWMRYAALAAGLLIVFSVTYGLLVFVNPALRSAPMTGVALGTLVALAALALALLALAALMMLAVLLWLPVAAVRALIRERRRKRYHFPTR